MKVTPVKKAFNQYKVGTVFTLPDAAARTLIKAGLLAEAVDEAPKRRQYRRRDMQAESLT